jgi:hypothetical protein
METNKANGQIDIDAELIMQRKLNGTRYALDTTY